jgi:hypothetical protein
MATWERSWELELPGSKTTELLLGLVIRDLLFGSSYDVEIEGSDKRLAVDYSTGDELTDESIYRLLISAEVEGPEDGEILYRFTEEILEEAMAEAGELVEQGEDLGSMAAEQITFKTVPEDEERWDLVIPDWLAPDQAEVPFGYRPYLTGSGEAWPDDSLLNAHGRVVMIPEGRELRLFGIPVSEAEE